jgi:DNA mismatch repair protein MutS
MTFHSILFARPEDRPRQESFARPDFFVDLNLDQVVTAVTAAKQEYDLTPFYYAPLRDLSAIRYRQEVAQALENAALLASINAFADKMRTTRRYLGLLEKLHYQYHIEGWFLEAAATYCEAVARLAADLTRLPLPSAGLRAFRDYVTAYASSETFTSLKAEIKQIKADLASVTYCVILKEDVVKVRKYAGEVDYSLEVEKTFAKFKQGAVKDYTIKLTQRSGINHIEAHILNLVAKLYPEIFSTLDDFYTRRIDFLDATIAAFDREIQFYVAYLEHVAPLRANGLSFCYPHVSQESKEVDVAAGFDLALAAKCAAENLPVVTNDYYLKGAERVLVISGPNQGGKTTFARTFGQAHYLAALGCPVPGRRAQLFLADRIFSHFEREEDIQNLRGKLKDDLARIHAVFDQASPQAILILNEIFSSTTLQDAVFLSQKIMERIIQEDMLCVWVTFVDELASFSAQTVSMVSTIAPENPAVRTFKLVRKPADGLTYAMSIAEKYRLTYNQIKDRIPS